MTWYERLSSLDATFLDLEDGSAHMHVGAVSIYEGPPPAYDDFAAHIAARLDRVPRYRQRLATVPLGLGRPVWVDAEALDLEYHVRHTAIPAAGGDAALRRLAGRVFAQRLDREKPLWELWLVEGLDRGRFAVISKTHHCMIDGVSGVDLATLLHDPAPRPPHGERAAPWAPRPGPAPLALAAASLADQVSRPFALARDALRPASDGRRFLRELAAGLRPLLGITQLGRAPDSSLNAPIGPHRRWEMASVPLDEVKRVRAALGGTVNDVVLAVISGALRALLHARGDAPAADLRAFVPVSIRREATRGTFGNQVAAVFCPLPVTEPDPVERLRKVSAAMKELKERKQVVGAVALTHLGELTLPAVATQVSRLDAMTRWFNLVVTNVPGPQRPIYMLGSRLLACHPCVPLARHQTLGVAVLSYAGAIDFGLLADADRMRDLPLFARAIQEAMAELAGCAARVPAPASAAGAVPIAG